MPDAEVRRDGEVVEDGGVRDGAADVDGAVDGGGVFRDGDRDGDGVPDEDDAFPDDPGEFIDPDGDGIGAFADPDEDGDGVPDELDGAPLDPSRAEPWVVDEAEPNDGAATPAEARFPLVIEGSLGPFDHDRLAVMEAPAGRYTIWVEGLTEAVSFYVATGSGGFSERTVPPAAPPFMEAHVLDAPTTLDIELRDERPFNGAPRPYRVHVFLDADVDGLDDDRERALGLRPDQLDSDGDGLPDPVELASPDPDADGIPSWLDRDSDGDGVRDAREGTSDSDGDGRPAFADPDADGDGDGDTLDSVDADGDGLVGFLDADDDGDGLPDADDPEPLAPMAVAPLDTLRVDRAFAVVGGTELEGFARASDSLVIRGVGFDASARVLFEGDAPRMVTPDAATDSELRVTVPDGAARGLRVLAGGARSQRLDLELQPAGAPILRPIAPLGPIGPSTRTAVEGENLALVMEARLDAGFIGIWGSTDTRIELAFAEAAHRGELRVRNAAGWSNPVFVRQETTTSGRVELPAGVSLSPDALVVHSSATETAMSVSATGSFFGPVAQGEPELLGAYVPGAAGAPDRAALLAWVFPGELSPVLDARSTALALVFGAAVRMTDYDPGRLAEIRDALDALPELGALESAVAAAMVADVTAVTAPPASLAGPLRAALVAADPILSSVEPNPFPGGLVSLISPEMQDDVTVRHPADDPEGLEIVNDTQLYLSARIARSDGVVPVPHADGAFGPGIIGTQGSLLQAFEPATRRYRAPRGHNAELTIVTGGLASPAPLAEEETIHRVLVLRSMLEKILVPILSGVLGDVFDQKALVHRIINVFLSNAVAGASSIWTSGASGTDRGRAVLRAFVDVLINDVTDAGPLTQAIADVLRASALRAAAAAPARIAARLIPVINGIRLVLDGVEAIGTFVKVAVAANDLTTTPGRLTFAVTFGFEARSVIPPWLDEQDLRGPQTFFINGQGFEPIFDAEGLLTYPEITFVPDEGDRFVVTAPDYILSDRTRMEVEAPAEVMRNVRNALEIRVRPGPGEPEVTLPPVEVRYEPGLLRADPPIARAGETITLLGRGFSARAGENEIRLRSGTTEVRMRPTSVQPDRVTFPLPGGVDDGGVWNVRVAIGPFGAMEETNEVAVAVGGHHAIGRWAISAGWDADPYRDFYDRETGSCMTYTPDLLPGQESWGLVFTEDGRVFGGRCNPSSLFTCSRNVFPTAQSYLGTWSLLGDGRVRVDTPNHCPPTGNESKRPTSWSLDFTADAVSGTTQNGCVGRRPCGVLFTPPTYTVSGSRVGF